MSENRSYDWWSGSPQDWRNEEREESLMDPKWNRSLSNTNELSEGGDHRDSSTYKENN